MTSARSAFDSAVSAHLDAAVHLRGASARAGDDVQVRQLHDRLNSQAARLGSTATQLGLPAPRLSVDGSVEVSQAVEAAAADVGQVLGQAETAMTRADTELGRALHAVTQPPLLPEASPVLRALAVYGGFCVLAWLVQFTLLSATDYQVLAAMTSLCGIPLLAFGAGMLTLHTLGQPRSGERITYSPKLGAAICFAGLPVLWVGLLVALALVRG